jgi:hypothetical protein
MSRHRLIIKWTQRSEIFNLNLNLNLIVILNEND